MRWCANSQFMSDVLPASKGVSLPASFPQARQLRSQFLGRSEKCIFGSLFSCIQHFSDGAQAEALVVFQFKYGALARSELAKRFLNSDSKYLAIEFARRIGEGAFVRYRRKNVDLIAGVVDDDCLILSPGLATAQLVEA